MALTFTQQQELETLLQEFKKENRLYGTIQITMNNDTTLFKTAKGVDGDTYEDIAYHRGYLAATNDYNTKLMEHSAALVDAQKTYYTKGYKAGVEDGFLKGSENMHKQSYDDGYDEGYEEGYDAGYLMAYGKGEE